MAILSGIFTSNYSNISSSDNLEGIKNNAAYIFYGGSSYTTTKNETLSIAENPTSAGF
jgi:hypothetical protein